MKEIDRGEREVDVGGSQFVGGEVNVGGEIVVGRLADNGCLIVVGGAVDEGGTNGCERGSSVSCLRFGGTRLVRCKT